MSELLHETNNIDPFGIDPLVWQLRTALLNRLRVDLGRAGADNLDVYRAESFHRGCVIEIVKALTFDLTREAEDIVIEHRSEHEI